MLEYVILGMLVHDSLTGYDIKKLIENGIGVFYKASFGSLYPLLKRLTKNGLVTSEEIMEGDRQKKYYTLTTTGKAAFHEWLVEPIATGEHTHNQLVKVYFFDQLDKEERDLLLKEYERNNEIYLKKLLKLEQHFKSLEYKDCFYYKLSTLYYGICILKETIRWCQHIRNGEELKDLL